MKKLILFLGCAALAWPCCAVETLQFARSRAGYSNQLARVDADYEATRRKLASRYVAALKELEEACRTQGDQEALLATQREARRFGRAGGVSASDVVPEPAQLARLQERCRSALAEALATRDRNRLHLLLAHLHDLQKLWQALTVKGDSGEALKVKGVVDELRKLRPQEVTPAAGEPGGAAWNEGPVAHYSFDGATASAIRDRSGNGKDPVLHGGEIEQISGRRGHVLRLDGVDDGLEAPVRVGDLPVTVALWFRKNDTAGGGGFIFGFHRRPGRRFYLGISPSTGSLGIGLGTSATQREGYGLLCDTNWHHCVVTYNPPLMTLFFDGIRIAGKSAEQVVEGTLTFGFGRDWAAKGEPAQFIGGMMDDIMVFDRVLDAEDVRRLFLATGGTREQSAAAEHVLRNRKPDDGAHVHGKHRYWLYQERCSWHDARTRCQNMGGHLVTIDSEDENKFVARLCGEVRTWLGATKEAPRGNWTWVDGRKVAFPKWAQLSISKSWGEHYLTMQNGTWSDCWVASSSVKGYVCEWE